MPIKFLCIKISVDGIQCTEIALSGSNYCSDHDELNIGKTRSATKSIAKAPAKAAAKPAMKKSAPKAKAPANKFKK